VTERTLLEVVVERLSKSSNPYYAGRLNVELKRGDFARKVELVVRAIPREILPKNYYL
jgi:hypothetical protein